MNHFQILLASNSNSIENMNNAQIRLKELFPREIWFSDLIESTPIDTNGKGKLDGPNYLNSICLAQSDATLEQIQLLLKKLETMMGRKKGSEGKVEVVIDLDLVLWNDQILRPWDVSQTYYKDCLLNLQKKQSN